MRSRRSTEEVLEVRLALLSRRSHVLVQLHHLIIPEQIRNDHDKPQNSTRIDQEEKQRKQRLAPFFIPYNT